MAANQNLLTQAVTHHQAGHYREAELLYKQLLSVQPRHPDALHFLGVLRLQNGHVHEAMGLIGQAVVIRPNDVDAIFNLGNAQKAAGLLMEAEQSFRKAVRARPQHPGFLCNLGNVLTDQNNLVEAVAAFRAAIQFNPGYHLAYNSLATALGQMGQVKEAETAFRSAISANPGYENAYANLARLLLGQSRWHEAELCLRQQLTLSGDNPDTLLRLGLSLYWQNRSDEALVTLLHAHAIDAGHFDVLFNLGKVRASLRQFALAEGHYRQALAIQPQSLEAHLGLASVLDDTGRSEEAITVLESTLALQPDSVAAHNNLANVLRVVGRHAEAIAHYEHVLRLDSSQVIAFSNLLNAMNFVPDHSPQEVFARHRDFDLLYAEPLRSDIQPHDNDRDPERQLRIGYVSAGFWNYPVGRFIEPVFTHANGQCVETFCYYTHVVNDEVTTRLRSLANHWRDCPHLSDEALAEQIRKDDIDVLVDLIGHIDGSRLLVFARKPAPIQVTWLAYMNTTGLTAMDYRITDRFADPEGEADKLHSEKLYRLPASQWCYAPPTDTPPVAQLPALRNGYITYGSFNAFTKVSCPALELWARILAAQPDSRLLVMCVSQGKTQAELAAFFQARGIAQDRILTKPFTTLDQYFAAYNLVDMALDTLPYSGGTTTCDGFWMGVPVVTLPGATSASRSSASLLTNVGLGRFVAFDADDYIAIAVAAGRHLPELSLLRQNLRVQMAASPLMDGKRLAQDLEAGFRTMWRDYLLKQP